MAAELSKRDWAVFRVGLTGGIASGKSTVAGMFVALGVPVIDTDEIARHVVAPGTPALAEIFTEFGPELRQSDGTLDRRRLRDLAFVSPERRARLDAILHPRIVREMEAESRRLGGPYQVLVVPLLIETGLDARVDRVLVVDCSEPVQRSRLMVRDGETGAHADRLLAAQLGRRERLARADDILDNDTTERNGREELRRRVGDLHATYLQLAAERSPPASKKGGA